MKNFIVTGDLHIRVKPELPEEWQMNRYRMLWAKYIELCKEHKSNLIIAGDVFENWKINSKEMRLFLELLQLTSEWFDVFIISGNHDYSDGHNPVLQQFEPFYESLRNVEDGGHVHYSEEFTYPIYAEGVQLTFIGHPSLKTSISEPKGETTNVLISHFRPNVNHFIKEEVDVEKFISGYDLCIAGDIHTDLEMFNGRLVYTNSPLNSHFETTPHCGCVLLTCDAGKVSTKRIPLALPNLVQITTTAADYEEPAGTFDYYRVEITGTPEELRKIKSENPSVKLLKVPETFETYVDSIDVEDAVEVRDQGIEEALIGYMVELEFAEAYIAKMIIVFREV